MDTREIPEADADLRGIGIRLLAWDGRKCRVCASPIHYSSRTICSDECRKKWVNLASKARKQRAKLNPKPKPELKPRIEPDLDSFILVYMRCRSCGFVRTCRTWQVQDAYNCCGPWIIDLHHTHPKAP